MLVLAACALTGATGPSPTTPGDGDGSLTTAPAPRGVEPTQVPAVADPALLVGLDGDSVAALLGKPGFSRHDGPARVLQYSSASCVLDLFLYKQESEATHRVIHVELRDLSTDQTTTVACMRSLAKPIRRHDA